MHSQFQGPKVWSTLGQSQAPSRGPREDSSCLSSVCNPDSTAQRVGARLSSLCVCLSLAATILHWDPPTLLRCVISGLVDCICRDCPRRIMLQGWCLTCFGGTSQPQCTFPARRGKLASSLQYSAPGGLLCPRVMGLLLCDPRVGCRASSVC